MSHPLLRKERGTRLRREAKNGGSWAVITGPKIAWRCTMIESSDLRMRRIPLNHGAGHMPALGFGALIPDAAVTITATRDALEAGFRHFDCAERYRNEREAGRTCR
jgi:hypothetical protein